MPASTNEEVPSTNEDQLEEEKDDGKKTKKKLKAKTKLKNKISEFIDDEAELSSDEEVSDDELEHSDDDQLDLELVDLEAKELSSEEEEDVRRLYHKQLENEDRRAVLLLQEQLEENEIDIGQRRRKKFRWQTKEIMENSLARHYNPDDEDSQDDEDDDDDEIYLQEYAPRLRRPTAEDALVDAVKRTRRLKDAPLLVSNDSHSNSILHEDSNSQPVAGPTTSKVSYDLNQFIYRDKELVQALNSTREVITTTREEKDRIIQRELKRVVQSKSIFDQLY